MPRLPTLRTPILQELARQLRFESADAARRQLVRAEELALQLLGESGAAGVATPEGFPGEWVVFRITGLRTEPAGGSGNGVVARGALLSDLPGLIDRLSAAAKLTERDLEPHGKRGGKVEKASPARHPATWLNSQELCERWGVSRKTLERYRRLGLMSRRVTRGRGAERVVYSEDAVRAFEGVHGPRIAGAGGFTRMDGAARARVLGRAARYRRVLGWTLHRCAQRIAAREGRSVEAIRGMLRSHDERSAHPLFDEPRPLDAAQASWLERSSKRGGNMAALAGQVRKSRASVYRAVGQRRAARLRELDLRGPVGPTFSRKDAGEVLLAHPAAREGLGGRGEASVGELVRAAAKTGPEEAAHEAGRAAAYWYLIWSARRGVEALPRHGVRVRTGDSAMDVIETRLLWASRVKAETVRSQLPLLVRAIENQTSRAITALPGAALRELCEVGLGALVEAVDRFDPFKGGRLAAPAGVGVARAVSQWLRSSGDDAGITPRPGAAKRAVARVNLDQLALEDWSLRAHPWQAWLEPPAGVRDRLGELPERERRVLELRFGWEGGPPRTLDEAAKEMRTTPTRIAAMQRRAVATLSGGVVRARRRTKKAAR